MGFSARLDRSVGAWWDAEENSKPASVCSESVAKHCVFWRLKIAGCCAFGFVSALKSVVLFLFINVLRWAFFRRGVAGCWFPPRSLCVSLRVWVQMLPVWKGTNSVLSLCLLWVLLLDGIRGKWRWRAPAGILCSGRLAWNTVTETPWRRGRCARCPCRPRFAWFPDHPRGVRRGPCALSLWSACRLSRGEGRALPGAAESRGTRGGKGGVAVRRSLVLEGSAALTWVSRVCSGVSGLGHG